MPKYIDKKPAIVYNGIPNQLKTAANSLTIKEWNDVVNTLKQQSNMTTEYIDKLHRVLFGDWDNSTQGVYEFLDEGLINEITAVISRMKAVPQLHVSSQPPTDTALYVWFETDTLSDDYLIYSGGDFFTTLYENILFGGQFEEQEPLDTLQGGIF